MRWSFRTKLGLAAAAVLVIAPFAACSSGGSGGGGAPGDGGQGDGTSADGAFDGTVDDSSGSGTDDSSLSYDVIYPTGPDGCFVFGGLCKTDDNCCSGAHCSDAGCVQGPKPMIETEE